MSNPVFNPDEMTYEELYDLYSSLVIIETDLLSELVLLCSHTQLLQITDYNDIQALIVKVESLTYQIKEVFRKRLIFTLAAKPSFNRIVEELLNRKGQN